MLSRYRVIDTPLRVAEAAYYPYSRKLDRRLRFRSRLGDEVHLARRVGDHLLVARALCPREPDETSDGEEVQFPARPEPRDYQVEAFSEIESMVLDGRSFVAVAGTGWGKTAWALRAVAARGRKALVVVTKQDLLEQWVESAREMLGLPAYRVGVIQQDRCETDGRAVCVAMIHSLSKPDRYPDLDRAQFGTVVYDETHRVPADQFSVVADMFPARVRIGMSATPRRYDGKDLLVAAHIGEVALEVGLQPLVPKVLRYKTGWTCPRVPRKIKGERKIVRMPHEPGKSAHVDRILAADPERTAMIADLVVTLYRKGRHTVVFSSLLSHLDSIERAVVQRGVSRREIGRYGPVSNVRESERRERVLLRPIITTTFGMMSEGTDVPWLDAGVLAMPRAQVEQVCGRIRREFEGKQSPVWVDLVDSDSPVYQAYSLKRLRWYRSIDADVVDMN